MSLIAHKATRLVSIPYRIKRSPTDLLKALSETVELDNSGPLYFFLDDTTLSPIQSFDKKKNALAKVSGIKAARFMIEQYPQAFMKEDCVPHISKFFPKKYFTEEELKYPNEDLIYSLISWGKLKEAFNTYQKCKDQKIDVSEACKLSLFEILCIYNSKDVPQTIHPLEKYFLQKKESNVEEEWNVNAEAEIMFKELNIKNSSAYCSMIKGMAKYGNVNGAKEYFNEIIKNGLIPDLSTMNEMIKLISVGNETFDSCLELINQRLQEIKKFGLFPNLQTFNNCLYVISNFGVYQKNIPFALNIIKEMELLDIKPSLATWNSMIKIFYPIKGIGAETQIFPQVLKEVEKMSESPEGLEWRDLNDSEFFKTAIEKCLEIPSHKFLIPTLHKILMKKNNIRFLNTEKLLTDYFENYLKCYLKYESPENVMKVWRNITPNILSVNRALLMRLLYYITENKCFEYVPELWTSFIENKLKAKIDDSSRIIKLFLEIMSEYKSKDQLASQFSSIAEIIIKNYPYKAKESPRARRQDEKEFKVLEYKWDIQMFENFFNIALNGNKIDLAGTELENFFKNSLNTAGEISEKTLIRLFETFLKNNKIDYALNVFDLTLNFQMKKLNESFLNELKSNQALNEEHRSYLRQFEKKI